MGSSFTIRITHMKGEEIFGSYKQKSNLLSKLKGIHINTIMSTPRMENHMCKLSGPFVAFITMKLRISPMEVLRSWKLLVEIKFDI